MADQFDILAQKRALQLVSMPANAGRGNQRPKILKKRKELAALLSKVLRGTNLSAEDQEALNNSPLKGKTAADLLSETTGALSLSGQETQDIYSSFKDQGELLKAAAIKSKEDAERAKETGSPVQSWWERGKGPLLHDTTPAPRGFMEVDPTEAPLGLDEKGDPIVPTISAKGSATPTPTSRQTVLDKARETLKGDTYQLGSSSYLTAAREMKKPTPFTQRTDEQVAAANVVGRDRIAGRERQAKADALSRASSKLQNLGAGSQDVTARGAEQWFKDTGGRRDVGVKKSLSDLGVQSKTAAELRSNQALRDLSGGRPKAPRKRITGPKEPPTLQAMKAEQREIDKKKKNQKS